MNDIHWEIHVGQHRLTTCASDPCESVKAGEAPDMRMGDTCLMCLCQIIESNNYTAPLKFSPSSLKGITYYMNVASDFHIRTVIDLQLVWV